MGWGVGGLIGNRKAGHSAVALHQGGCLSPTPAHPVGPGEGSGGAGVFSVLGRKQWSPELLNQDAVSSLPPSALPSDVICAHLPPQGFLGSLAWRGPSLTILASPSAPVYESMRGEVC